VDFALSLRDHLLVYGWVLGLAERVARAEIRYGNLVIDLMTVGVPVPRPDVMQHFSSHGVEGDQHGFYLAVALPGTGIRPGYLRLFVAQFSGEAGESVWPVTVGDAASVSLAQQRNTIDFLLKHLSTADADQLRDLTVSDSAADNTMKSVSLALDMAPHVERCCLLEQRILVMIGWLDERDVPLTAVTASLGDEAIECLQDMTFARRSGEARQTLRGETGARLAFTWVGIAPQGSIVADAVIEFRAGARRGQVRRTLTSGGSHELGTALQIMDPDAALDVLARIAGLMDASAGGTLAAWLVSMQTAAVARLPVLLENREPRVLLHPDSIVPIADAGVYITGWMYAAEGAVREIAFHSGFQRMRLDDHWFRQTRRDVAAHLSTEEATGEEADYGYLCYVRLANTGAPYFLSVTLASGAVHRIRLQPVSSSASALQTVRMVLASITPTQRSLRTLLDQQVGPAVSTAWARRRRPMTCLKTQRFGPAVAEPAVSVIVPLFARHDLADYQLASFADDADFQSLELIYFVDDPSIHDAFSAQCHDLYEIYRVPFTLAFAGVNLGFAGANNCAATLATGRHLLLLNSDVMPKSPGWVGDMLTLYATLKSPGFLGVKLLYEDGSVQHAGMSFRRHAPWNGLWINEHPHKGQSAVGLQGVRKVEAVTAACALVDAALYHELGGLSEDYIIGDFEDSDFCLRAAAAGRPNWVALDIELYHLERQSQARIGEAQWRTNLTLFNCWQHHQRWGAHLEKHTR
jgi:GT2 family glycosyltransferase